MDWLKDQETAKKHSDQYAFPFQAYKAVAEGRTYTLVLGKNGGRRVSSTGGGGPAL